MTTFCLLVISNTKRNYTTAQVDAYLNGSLSISIVRYTSYNRAHRTDATHLENEILLVG
jgi:hypothetical protein